MSKGFRPIVSEVVRKGRNPNLSSFEVAKQYVRQLNFQSYAEWNRWVSTNRSPCIPRSPEQVYRNAGWVSYPDFVGYEAKERTSTVSRWVRREPESSVDKSLGSGFSAGGAAVANHMLEEADPELECRYLPRRLNANLLVRHRTVGEEHSGWIALRILHEHRDKGGRKLRFSSVKSADDVQLCLYRDETQEFAIIDPVDGDFIRKTVRVKTLNHEVFQEAAAHVVSNIRNLCQDVSRTRSFWDWSLALTNDSVIRIHIQMLYDLELKLYRKARVLLQFPEPSSVGHPLVNSYLDGHRCIHKKAKEQIPHHYFIDLRRKHADRVYSHYNIDDEFDLIIGSIYESGMLHGVFVLPKTALSAYLESGDQEGKACLGLYPPYTMPTRRGSREKQLWQSEYYIDLSENADANLSVAKLRRIIQTIKAPEEVSPKAEVESSKTPCKTYRGSKNK